MSAADVGATRQQSSLSGVWSLVPAESTASFSVRDKVFTTVTGSLPVVAGHAEIGSDADAVGAWVDLAVEGIATGNSHRDKDLTKPRFLDSEHHPVIRVELGSAKRTDNGWQGHGTLTARGRTAHLRLTAETVDVSAERVRVRVNARLDREPLKIKVPSFVIGQFLDLVAELSFSGPSSR